MKISVTIPSNSELESQLRGFNKHERSALIKMALTRWFYESSSSIVPILKPKYAETVPTMLQDLEVNPLKQVMGDFSD